MLFVAKEGGDELDEVMEEDKSIPIIRWVGTGFALLTGILTYFGIAGGVLDRLLAESPKAALFVFVLVGSGVVLALFVPALSPNFRLAAFWLPLVALVLLILSINYFPDFPGENNLVDNGTTMATWTVLAIMALSIPLLWIFDKTISSKLGVLLIAVIAVSLGLYGGAKLSIDSKILPSQMSVIASLQTESEAPVIKVTAKGSADSEQSYIVEVVGDPGSAGQVTMGTAVLVANNLGNIDTSLSFPQTRTIGVGL